MKYEGEFHGCEDTAAARISSGAEAGGALGGDR